jgi:GTP-binding protein
LKVLSVEFVTSAPDAAGIPNDGVPQIALVGRSNVGKSSLINALTHRKVARASAAPGKTRLANIYRVTLSGAPVRAVDLVDLPGYGYARGGDATRKEFEALVEGYLGPVGRARRVGRVGGAGQEGGVAGVILAMDGRHPGLATDLAAYGWARTLDLPTIVVTTKVDRMSRAERDRARRQFENSLRCQVLPVSAVTGEGLEDLWKQIVRLPNRLPPKMLR